MKVKFSFDKVLIFDNNKNLCLAFYYLKDEFVCEVIEPLRIYKNDNLKLYKKLENIINSKYIFDTDGINVKTDHKLIWTSDQCCDSQDKNKLDTIAGLIIEKVNDSFVISCYDSYHSKKSIVLFKTDGRGRLTLNTETGSTLQEDIQREFYKNIKEEKDIKLKVKRLLNSTINKIKE